MEGHFAAELLVRALSDRLTGKLTLKNGPPGYDAETRTLTVPAWPTDDFPPDELRRLRAFLSHESARYGQQTWNEKAQPWKDRPGFLSLVTGLTAPVYDINLADEFPGAGMNIKATLKEEALDIEAMNKAEPFEPTVAMLGTLLRLQKSGIRSLAELEAAFPQFQSMFDKAKQACATDAHSEAEALEQAKLLHKLINDPDPPQEQPPQAGEGEGEGDGEGDEAASGSGTENQDPNAQGKPKPKPYVPPKDTSDKDYKLDEQMLKKALKSGGAWPETTGNGTYTFSREADTFVDLVADQTTDMHKVHLNPVLRRNAQVLATVLRRALQTEQMLVQRRQIRGSLDSTRLVQLVTGKSAAVMKRKRLQPGINVAVSISIDASGSMSSQLKLTQNTLQVLNSALATLDVPVEILTWTTGYSPNRRHGMYQGLYRQEPMYMELVKGFQHSGESPQVTRAIEAMDTRGSTPMGEGLHFAAERLASRPENRKVLFLLTDGYPGFNHNGPSQIHDEFIKETIIRSAKSGIEVVGIGIGVKLEKYFTRSIFIRDVTSLGTVFQQEVLRVLLQERRKHAASLQ